MPRLNLALPRSGQRLIKLTLLTLLVAAAGLMQTPLKTSKPLDKVQLVAFAARGVSHQRVASNAASISSRRTISPEPCKA